MNKFERIKLESRTRLQPKKTVFTFNKKDENKKNLHVFV